VDLASRKDFISNNLNNDEIAQAIGADAVFYEDLKDLEASVKVGNLKIKNFCTGCLSGKYPTPDITEEVLQRAEITRGGIESEFNGDSDSQLILI